MTADPFVEQVAQRVAEILADRDEQLVDAARLAELVGSSVTTINRFVRGGMPFQWVGAQKRFSPAACRAWLRDRGRRAAEPERDEQGVEVNVAGVALRTPRRGRG